MDVGWWWKGDEWRTMCEKEQLMPKEDTAQPLDKRAENVLRLTF